MLHSAFSLYEVPPEHYKKLRKENVTKTYKKANDHLYNQINEEAKSIASNLGLDNRIESLAKSEAFITLKDHKENFHSKPTCRLINPAKSEIGKISKSILDTINTDLRKILHYNQWKNTRSVIEWFNNVKDKHLCTFIQLDIKDFYPSITPDILDNAISFAKQHVHINDESIQTIKHCRKSLLFNGNTPWVKKSTAESFDVTMGSYDGAEVCELVGLFILSKLDNTINKEDSGLYRDDGLFILRKTNGKQADAIRKRIIQTFKDLGFQIDIQCNLKQVNFLDVTFNLSTATYHPFKKENDKLLYINTSSNHPPTVIDQIPTSIGKRLSDNSSNERIFEDTKPEYQNALKNSGHPSNFSYSNHQPNTRPQTRTRKRQILWFNPPFNKSVQTNIGRIFLHLIEKYFPKSNRLHKIFNKNTIKLSYSCTENIQQIIKKHNKRIMKQPERTQPTIPCNCRNKTQCPLQGSCNTQSVIYNATVTTPTLDTKTYIGLTEGPWKQRYSQHKLSFNNHKYEQTTTLSKFIWNTKRQTGKTPEVSWSISKPIPSYTNTSKRCLLCLSEKLSIVTFKHPTQLLNKRSELLSKCRHENKFLLRNFKSKDWEHEPPDCR